MRLWLVAQVGFCGFPPSKSAARFADSKIGGSPARLHFAGMAPNGACAVRNQYPHEEPTAKLLDQVSTSGRYMTR
jgi:hypothetical protein